MKFKEYLKDKFYAIILTFLSVGIIYLIFKAFRIKTGIIFIGIIIFFVCIFVLLGGLKIIIATRLFPT